MRARGVTPRPGAASIASAVSVASGARGGPIAVALCALLALAAGCSDSKKVPTKPYVPAVPEYTLQELLAAPDYLKFDGITFDVSVYLNRDFMPSSSPEGQPLAATVTVTAPGEPAFPAGVTSAYVWVVKGSEVWSSWMAPQGSGAGAANQRVYFAGGGPLWTPGILVDVVVGLRTSPTAVHLVLIQDVAIERTD